MPRPYNSPTDDCYSTSPERDKRFCELLEVMDNCANEQLDGCDKCKTKDRCAEWMDKKTDIGTGYFTPERLVQCKAEFAVIKAKK